MRRLEDLQLPSLRPIDPPRLRRREFQEPNAAALSRRTAPRGKSARRRDRTFGGLRPPNPQCHRLSVAALRKRCRSFESLLQQEMKAVTFFARQLAKASQKRCCFAIAIGKVRPHRDLELS